MKIECDKCSAKYSIADEKVRGKTFKIRCKKCSNVIIVRDKVAAAAAGGGGAEAAVDQAHPGWHLAINGETVGPMSEDEVRQRYEAGEIDKDTAIWQEGFEDWVPLGDVEGFADLPDRAATSSSGDDPFASANQDDYAAAGGVAAAAAQQPAAAVGDPMAQYGQEAQPQSPRVSSLTGQRNENSVLFSLDSLQALATGGGGQAAAAAAPAAASGGPGNARTGTKGLATVAPGSEGSGLIDIRALGAMVGADNPAPTAASTAGAAADDAALPSFGGSGLGGLAAAPLVPQTVEPTGAAAAAVAQPPPRSNGLLYAMMAILILAVVGLGVYIVLKPPPEPVVVTQETPEAPSVKAAGADEDKDEDDDDKGKDEDEDEDKDKDEDKDEDKADGGEGDDAAGEGDDAGTLADASGGKGKGRSGKGKGKGKGKGGGSKSPLDGFPSGSSSSSSSSSKPPPASSKGKKGSDLDVDCILDPKACGKGKSSSSKKPAQTGASDPSLPEKLSTTDIRAGVAPVKGAAKACGGKHGAKKGEKVKVKLSISGKSGGVTKATAQSPHAGTPLGNCVASALKRAKFKKFRKPSLGAVYPVTM